MQVASGMMLKPQWTANGPGLLDHMGHAYGLSGFGRGFRSQCFVQWGTCCYGDWSGSPLGAPVGPGGFDAPARGSASDEDRGADAVSIMEGSRDATLTRHPLAAQKERNGPVGREDEVKKDTSRRLAMVHSKGLC